ncbi:AsmA family protein [Marinimicrobium alkaliphilum]|uniref:AsmA family protein n=1 Tax=Marinimicrobium alkaliphilum TaxID=2202654 RepID=UPI000DB9F4DD|nr:AsmA family protein [Marinimicrobium alkaliphilum]
MKRLLKIFAVLIALLVILVIGFFLFFDPNVFKPRIESMAREQGVDLRIQGDLGWQLWPSIGVEVNGIRVAAVSEPEDAIAELDRASLLLALRPLFRGEVQVHHVIVEGARINARIDEEGVGNWEALLPDDDAPDTAAEPEPEVTDEEDRELVLAVERITLRDSALSYSDARTGQAFEVQDLGFELRNFNLQGEPFDLQSNWMLRITDPELFDGQTLSLSGELRGDLQVAADFDNARLTDGRLELTASRGNESADMTVELGGSARNLLEDLSFDVTLRLRTMNPREWLAVMAVPPLDMADDSALTRLSVRVNASGDLQQVALEPIQITLDDTRINGHVRVPDLEAMALRVVLNGDQLDVDRYLPPPADEDEVVEDEATGDEELIPLELIRELDLELVLTFDQLTVMAFPMRDLEVRLSARDGQVNLDPARLNLYDGTVGLTASLDARGDTAEIRFDAGVDQVQLEPFMRDRELDEMIGLSGAITVAAEGNTRGVTMNQIMGNMHADASLSGAQVRVAPINVEELFCQAVNTLSRVERGDRDWPDYTEMRQLAGTVQMRGWEITVEEFNAGVQQLIMGLTGGLNLDTSAYDIRLPLRLGESQTSEHGCRMTSNYWVDRSLSLVRCRGTLTELNPLADCRIDGRGLESLAREFAEFQVRERYGDQIDDAQQRIRQEEQRARDAAEAAREEAERERDEARREAEERLERERREAEERAREEGRDRLRGLIGR